jgi:hypothetical protein
VSFRRALLLVLPLIAPAAAASAVEDSPPSPPPVWAEVSTGSSAPLGSLGVAAVFAPRPWLGVGLGLGVLDDLRSRSASLRTAIFTRLRLVQAGPFDLAATATLSRGHHQADEGGLDRNTYWMWTAGYRAHAGLAAGLATSGFKLRVEGGVGYLFTNPDACTVVTVRSSDDCKDVDFSLANAPTAARLAPYLAVTLGREVSGADEPPGRALDEDPRIDRAGLAPTALTLPKGDVSFTLYEGLLLHAAVGVTDRLQLGVGLGTNYLDGGGLLGTAEAKVRLLDAGLFHLAALGEAFATFGLADELRIGALGGVASFCLDEGCASVLSAALLATGITFQGDDGSDKDRGLFALLNPSMVVALARHLRLVAEAYVVPASGLDESFWVVGARIPYRRFSLDLGTIGGQLPYLGLTVRL